MTTTGRDSSPDHRGGDTAALAVTGFTIADREYFVGLVAMLTSLRRQGHDFPVVILDLGLTAPQREILERDFGARAVQLPEAAGRHPHLLGPFAHLLDPTGIVVYLDADLFVTRPFDDLLAAAADGKVCAVTDLASGRWFAEWEQALSLGHPVRREAYVNLGCVVFSTEHFPDLLDHWWDGCARLAETFEFPTAESEPFAFADQDVLNALLLSEVPAERRLTLPLQVQPMRWQQLARTEVTDLRTFACTFDGRPTAFLHPVVRPKPWQHQWHRTLYGSGYERCLREVVATSPAAVRVAGAPLPLWLRPGRMGTVRWRAATIVTKLVRAVRRPFGALKRAVRDRR